MCVQTGTTTELNLSDFARSNNLGIKPVTFENVDQVTDAYGSGRCDAYTTDASQLYSQRLAVQGDRAILDAIAPGALQPAAGRP